MRKRSRVGKKIYDRKDEKGDLTQTYRRKDIDPAQDPWDCYAHTHYYSTYSRVVK